MDRRYAFLLALGVSASAAVRPWAVSASTESGLVAALAAGLVVGEPVRVGRIALFPLAARDALREPATRIVTIAEALERAWVSLRERRLESAVGLLVDSWADAAVFLAAGEELPGRPGASVARDVLVPPGARGLCLPIADPAAGGGLAAGLATAIAAFPATCEGIIVTVGPRIVRLDLFPSAWFFVRMRPRLFRAPLAAFTETEPGEAVQQPAAYVSREEAEGFLRRLAGLAWERRPPVGLGLELAGTGPGLDASALFLGGALVHLVAGVPGVLP